MAYHEGRNPEVAVPPDDLATLYEKTHTWLEEHGKLFIAPDISTKRPSRTLGLHEGLPINNGSPSLQVALKGDVIRHVTPRAAEQLRVGEELALIYALPHYTVVSKSQLQLQRAECQFSIERDDPRIDPTNLGELLSIGFNEDAGEWESDRSAEPIPNLPGEEPKSGWERLVQSLTEHGFSEQLGTNRMTYGEQAALEEIVDNADMIRYLMAVSAL